MAISRVEEVLAVVMGMTGGVETIMDVMGRKQVVI